ncbi:MAG TPA: LLM class F420-dependent oxidoreductase [Candidatus Dormibacteraeota bacterium]|nr:LLM class F420-dependent oxidoreductase [Candidatus Dormibacteraeota bacterium]
MRFGIQTGPQHVTWPELVNIWQVADNLKFDTAWTFDHFFPIMSDPKGSQLEGWITLTALAMKTAHVRVGTLVTGITYREPAVLAKMGATLDVITGGRLEMGVGAAWFQQEHEALGITFPPVAERIRRLGEACEIMKRMWTEDAATWKGRYYEINDAYCNPKPVQKPHPPILIGGGGEQLTLKMVARYADTWNAFGTPDIFKHKIEVLQRHCEAIGRDPNTIEKSVSMPPVLSKDRSKLEAMLSDMASRRAMPIEEAKATMLWGSPDDAIKKIKAYRDMGVTHIILSLRVPYDPAQLELFAHEVIPALRETAPISR